MKSNIFLVQVGHNGSKLTKQAIKQNYADGAILSPADYEYEDNKEMSKLIHEQNGIVLFDNQWYYPRSDRVKLSTYDYYKDFGGDDYDTVTFETKKSRDDLCKKILEIQDLLSVDAYISPATYIDTYSDTKIKRYIEISESFIEYVSKNGRKIPILVTLPVSNKVLIDIDHRNNLLDYITSLKCDGFYISYYIEEAEGYPMNRPADILGLISFVYSLKQNKYYVLMGHSHHISYILLCAGIDGFASGHYKNLRSFDLARWDGSNIGGRTPAVNYFSIPMLNDLRKESDLELLYQHQVEMNPIKSKSPFEDAIFTQSPSLAEWKHRESWDHYLWCCNKLLEKLKDKTLEKRIEEVETHLINAEKLYKKLTKTYILTQPDEKIFNSWKGALNFLKTKMNKS